MPPSTATSPSPSPPTATVPGFRIRRARRGDAEALASLLRELGFPEGSDTQTVHWVTSHPEIEIFVACDAQDRPVGMISLSHRPQLRLKGRIATVDELVVTETWRRRGVGRALLLHAIERTRVLSVKRLELAARSAQGDGLARFYQACGFVEDCMVFHHGGA
ncbi:GNAT family N-acetyltransferase [Stigmatella erecta]|uniref:N-acetylglutamate synthase, GNAT family n=1 Tax=Stigmatella erecta TaxID=83460 RepID=A0A1I0KVB4_9BACT|nr:GNAT family N-acetyltransferase [Stigmatella erecta]SEU29344.1 N-acetylglutamate synthase, GNAT family [Stigmatella erecta]